MSWRWQRRPDQPGEVTPPTAEVSLSPDVLIAQADASRDARRWGEAAELYRSALGLSPDRAAIWVQLGNCRKEAGDRAGAEAAYRRSLELAPDSADTHVQLGHVLKLQGDAIAAIASYARALRADRFSTPALLELIALGEGWRAEQESGIGGHLLGQVLRSVEDLRRSLARLEQSLPNIASLTAFPASRYDLFAAQFRLPEPPGAIGPLRWAVVVFIAGSGGDVTAVLRGLARAGEALVHVSVVAPPNSEAPADVEAEIRQMTLGGVTCPVQFVRSADSPELPPCEWVLAIDSRAVPVVGALDWLSWAAGRARLTAIYCDEDHVQTGEDGMLRVERPVLKAASDPEADVPLFRHGMLALRADVAEQLLADAVTDADPIVRLTEAVERAAGVAHLARILCSRIGRFPPPLPRRLPPQRGLATSQTRQLPRIASGADSPSIAVIIPTRNGGTTLARCLAALRATAAEPGGFEIVLLDNGSDQPETLALLGQARAGEATRVLRDDAPFNWSRLSNAGAAAATADLLLFLNDDVELKSSGWDAVLRCHLDRPEIGGVGARLLYPDGGVQHAGMVFGPDGRAEHEGVAAVGVLPDIAARWTARRRVGAVTGAFLGCRRSDFSSVGGFDESHLPIWFNDVDFCLKLRRAGRWILYAPEIVAAHYESRTLAGQPDDARRRAIWDDSLAEMKRRWGSALQTDAGFNPYFARTGRPFESITEPSSLAIEAHLVRSAQDNPWAVA
jgi:GT2 family glycosyltransferase